MAQLADVSDFNVVLDSRNKLDVLAYYDKHEVERVAHAVSKPNAIQADLDAARGPMIKLMPLRPHRAVSILARSGDPGAPDVQSACAETAVRIVRLGGLIALLAGREGAAHQAQRMLVER